MADCPQRAALSRHHHALELDAGTRIMTLMCASTQTCYVAYQLEYSPPTLNAIDQDSAAEPA